MATKLVDFKLDFEPSARALGKDAPAMVPYVAAATLTALAGDARTRLQKRMPEVFDRPTDFTVRGVYTRGANKSDLTAEVYVPESNDASGKPKREYIRPGAEGASRRNQKKTEYLLTRIGALPQEWVTTPGKGAQLDRHGNVPGSVYKQIINVLQIRYNKPKPVSGRSQTAAKRLGVPALFFAVAPGLNSLGKNGGWLPPGVWKHLPGGAITQVLKFVKKASYRPRLDVQREVRQAVEFNIDRRWREQFTVIQARFKARARR
ncbi:MAG: hypothetical protein AB7P37_03310 [Ramlibacter sp.]